LFGGADRIRTGDLRVANAPLSQLSYSPISIGTVSIFDDFPLLHHRRERRIYRMALEK
jgi:hypothetical protein